MAHNLAKVASLSPAQQEQTTSFSPDLVKQIAMDIGKAVAHHIETMYPAAVQATSKSMLLSVRNCVHNEIIAALKDTDEAAILKRLAERKRHRRKAKAAYSKFHDHPPSDDDNA